MDEGVDVAEPNSQQAREQLPREGLQDRRVNLHRAHAFRWLNRIACRTVIEWGHDNQVRLLRQQFERLRNRQHVHADRHVLAVIFKYSQRQHHRPVSHNGRPDLMR